jgi:hypothetical protein
MANSDDWIAILSISHSIPLLDALSLDLGAKLSYAGEYYIANDYGSAAGASFGHAQFDAGLNYALSEKLSVGVKGSFSSILDSDVRDDIEGRRRLSRSRHLLRRRHRQLRLLTRRPGPGANAPRPRAGRFSLSRPPACRRLARVMDPVPPPIRGPAGCLAEEANRPPRESILHQPRPPQPPPSRPVADPARYARLSSSRNACPAKNAGSAPAARPSPGSSPAPPSPSCWLSCATSSSIKAHPEHWILGNSFSPLGYFATSPRTSVPR